MVVLGLLACQGDPDGTDPQPDPCRSAPTWDGFAHGYVTTWCTSCHSASLVGQVERQGATVGVDFDTWSQVHERRDAVEILATGPAPAMPPLGGVPEADVALFAEWLACGAEGHDEAPGPCDALTVGPAATVADEADVEALCAAGNVVEALTITGAVEVGCLCAVEGDLVVGGDVGLPLLERVDGSVRGSGTSSALRAPELETVGGDVVFAGDPVTALDLRGVVTIAGDLRLTELPSLGSVSFDALYAVGGELLVARDPALVSLDLPRLRTVGGRFGVEELPALVDLLGTRSLEAVGGDLVLDRLDVLPVLDDFAFLRVETVGGDLVVARSPEVTAIHGLALVADVGGDVVIADLATLVRVEGLDNLAHVGGDVRVERNPRLESVNGLIALTEVDGTLVLEDLPDLLAFPGLGESLATIGGLRLARIGAPALPAFQGLTSVAGELRVEDAEQLARIDGFPALTALGGLTIASNASLDAVVGFDALLAIDGDVAVTDNPTLSQAAVDAWLGALAVGGTTTTSGNAP